MIVQVEKIANIVSMCIERIHNWVLFFPDAYRKVERARIFKDSLKVFNINTVNFMCRFAMVGETWVYYYVQNWSGSLRNEGIRAILRQKK